MFDLSALLWHFLRAQPFGHVLELVPWHELLLLCLLGLLSAFGLHFIIGYALRFYRRGERVAVWISYPTLALLLITVQLLLSAYLLGIHAPELVKLNLSDRLIQRLGGLLLEPAFLNPALEGADPEQIGKSAVKAALNASSELEYRDRLRANLVDPAELAVLFDPASGVARAPGTQSVTPAMTQSRALHGTATETYLIQIGLRWITEPHRTAIRTPDTGEGDQEQAQSAQQPFFLPEFLLSLIDELRPEVALSRANWEHVAGTRFVQGTLDPLMAEYLSYSAGLLVVVVVLLNAGYFLAMRRLKRIGRPRREGAVAERDAPLPPAIRESAPSPEPVKPGAAPLSVDAESTDRKTDPSTVDDSADPTRGEGKPQPGQLRRIIAGGAAPWRSIKTRARAYISPPRQRNTPPT